MIKVVTCNPQNAAAGNTMYSSMPVQVWWSLGGGGEKKSEPAFAHYTTVCIGGDDSQQRKRAGSAGRIVSLELILKGSVGQEETKVVLTPSTHHRKAAAEWLKALKKVSQSL